jgi:hypothetical protein
MKHADSQAGMLNRGKDKSTSERAVASPSGCGLGLLRSRVSSTEQFLDTVDAPMLDKLETLAKEGCTLFEIANAIEVDYVEITRARLLSAEFNGLCNLLETQAASVHLRAAREGITNPESFSAAAYDRVMGALGFAPHVH